MALDSPPPLALSSDDPVEKKLEQLAARELRLAKKEKDVAAKTTELERKLKAVEDQEEKQGSVAQRELALEQATHALQTAQKDLKRKEKLTKDAEHVMTERDKQSTDREAQSLATEKRLNAREKQLDEREAKSREDIAHAQKLTTDAAARFQRLESDEQDLHRRAEELQTTEKLFRRREQALTDDEKEGARRLKDLREKEEACEKMSQTLQVRQSALTNRELSNQSERDRLTKLSKQLADEEKARTTETEHLTTLREELHRVQSAAEEAKHIATKEQDEASVRIAEATLKHNTVEKQMLELVQLQRELSATKAELSQSDADLKKRERRIVTDSRDLENNNIVFQHKKREFEAALAKMQVDANDLASKRQALTEQEREFRQTQARHEKDFAALANLEANLRRKSEAVSKKEAELVQWLREVEWREVVLGDREANVDREPIPLTVSASTVGGFPTASMDAKRGSIAGGTLSNGSFGVGGGGGATGLNLGARRQSSVGFATQNETPPSRVEAMEDQEERKAYGKALVEVQLRRLKDRYVSAQLKWATLEVQQQQPGGGAAQKSTSPSRGGTPGKRTASGGVRGKGNKSSASSGSKGGAADSAAASAMRVWTKAGIRSSTMQSHEEEVRRATALESQRRLVHRLSVELLRALAKMRTFDANEPDDSPEKIQESALFSDQEKTVVTFAVNFEFLMKHVEVALSSVLTSCPFDAKDTAVDAKDLLDKALVWWEQQRLKLTERLQQLLVDRKKFLTSATEILERHQHQIVPRRGAPSDDGSPSATMLVSESTLGAAALAAQALDDSILRRHGSTWRQSPTSPAAGENNNNDVEVGDAGANLGHMRFNISPTSSQQRGGGQQSLFGVADELSPGLGKRRQSLVDHAAESPILAPCSGPTLRASKLKNIELDAIAYRKRRESSASANNGGGGVPPLGSGESQQPAQGRDYSGSALERKFSVRAQQHSSGLVLPASTSPQPLRYAAGSSAADVEDTQSCGDSGDDEKDQDGAKHQHDRTTEHQSSSAGRHRRPVSRNTSPPPPLPHHSRDFPAISDSTLLVARPGSPGQSTATAFGTLSHEVVTCLMRTGRAQSAEPAVLVAKQQARVASSHQQYRSTADAALSPGRSAPSPHLRGKPTTNAHHPHHHQQHTFHPPALWTSEYPKTVPLIILQQQRAASAGGIGVATSPSEFDRPTSPWMSSTGGGGGGFDTMVSPTASVASRGGHVRGVSPDRDSTPSRRTSPGGATSPAALAAAMGSNVATPPHLPHRYAQQQRSPHLQGSLTTVSSPYLGRVLSATAQKKLHAIHSK